MYKDNVINEINESIRKTLALKSVSLEDRKKLAVELVTQFKGIKSDVLNSFIDLASNGVEKISPEVVADGIYLAEKHKVEGEKAESIKDFLTPLNVESINRLFSKYHQGDLTLEDRLSKALEIDAEVGKSGSKALASMVVLKGVSYFKKDDDLLALAKRISDELPALSTRSDIDYDNFKNLTLERYGDNPAFSEVVLEVGKDLSGFNLEQVKDGESLVFTATSASGKPVSTHTVSTNGESGIRVSHQKIGSSSIKTSDLSPQSTNPLSPADLEIANKNLRALYNNEYSRAESVSLEISTKTGIGLDEARLLAGSLSVEEGGDPLVGIGPNGAVVGVVTRNLLEPTREVVRGIPKDEILKEIGAEIQKRALELRNKTLASSASLLAERITEDAIIEELVVINPGMGVEEARNHLAQSGIEISQGAIDVLIAQANMEISSIINNEFSDDYLIDLSLAGGLGAAQQEISYKMDSLYSGEVKMVEEALKSDLDSIITPSNLAGIISKDLERPNQSIAEYVQGNIINHNEPAPEKIEQKDSEPEIFNPDSSEVEKVEEETKDVEFNYTQLLDDDNTQYVIDMLLEAGVRFTESGEPSATYVAALDNSPVKLKVHDQEGNIVDIDSSKEIMLINGGLFLGDKREGVNYGKYDPEKTLEAQKNPSLEGLKPEKPAPKVEDDSALTEEELKRKKELEEKERLAASQRPGSGGGGGGGLSFFGKKNNEKQLKADDVIAAKLSAKNITKAAIENMKESSKLIDLILLKGPNASVLEISKLSRALELVDSNLKNMSGHKGIDQKSAKKVETTMKSLMEKADKAGGNILLKGKPLKDSSIMKGMSKSLDKVIEAISSLFKGRGDATPS